ncbi:hypothetical protein [Streptomyces sp. NPDC056105]|uniref:hypothetical protein n=1 Tax=Streptomyces sp. NPDC056105 TaxID=3345714 RepID=UPI0035D88FC3
MQGDVVGQMMAGQGFVGAVAAGDVAVDGVDASAGTDEQAGRVGGAVLDVHAATADETRS